ncbi:MAG: hypothetical protein M3436_19095 [Pseudomonadota bacterium]|nr:hypothetical protein [Pseudomonadota bacterium]
MANKDEGGFEWQRWLTVRLKPDTTIDQRWAHAGGYGRAQSQQADAFDPLRGRDGIGFVDLRQALRHSILSGRRDAVKDDSPAVLAP